FLDDFHDGVEFADVNLRVAERARHAWIHLSDDVLGFARGIETGFDGNAHAAISPAIGGGDVDESDIDGNGSVLEELFNFAEMDRNVVGAAFVDRNAHVGSD